MRALYLHVDYLRYKTVKPALKSPPDPPGEASIGESLVVFVTVERGDGEGAVVNAVSDIVAHAGRIKVGRVVLYPYAHLSSNLASPGDAHRLLRELESRLKGAGLEVHRAPFGWYKEFELKCKGHPLAELSRSFGGAARGETWDRFYERWSVEAREAFERLGFNSSGGMAALTSLAYALAGRPFSVKLVEAGSREGAVAKCKDVDGGPVLAFHSGDPWTATLGPIEGDVAEAMAAVDERLAGALARADGVVVYSRNGAPLASDGCITPLKAVVLSILQEQLEAARSEGATPQLKPWLHPLQAVVIPVREEHAGYAEEVAREVAAAGLRVEVWLGRGLGKRVREAGRRWIPLVLVVGEQEAESRTVNVRRRWEPGKQEVVTLQELAEEARRIASGDPAMRPRRVPL